MNKKLIFFGGTFDPPHAEHVAMVKACSEELKPDKIIIMPTFIPPHKKTFMTASPTQRLEMCKIAFSEIENVEVSSWELEKRGKSYSYLTMEYLAKRYGGYDIFFLMGTDMLSSFHTWKNPYSPDPRKRSDRLHQTAIPTSSVPFLHLLFSVL